MNGLFRIIVVIFLFSLTSCKNYYYFNGQQKVETNIRTDMKNLF